jgi:phosphatidate cytidylyltransferase
MDNFASRMVVNVIGVPLILILIYFGGIPFLLFIMIVSIISQIEFNSLVERKDGKPLLTFNIIASILWMLTAYYRPDFLSALFFAYLICLFTIILFKYVSGSIFNTATTLLEFGYITICLSLLVLLRTPNIANLTGNDSRRLIMLIFITIWVGDSLAYLLGKSLGKRKIAPKISPNKSVVGSVSELVGAVLVGILFFYLKLSPRFFSLFQVIIFGLLVGLFSQLGDFLESAFKRDAGVKDTSRILLGHGGVLDRFDAFFITAPVIYLFVKVIL